MLLPAQPNRSLLEGLDVLQAVIGRPGGVGSRELARELGLEPTRVNRLLKTLAHAGLARQDEDRRYWPGPGVHALAAQAVFGSGLVRRAAGPLERLHDTGLVVALGVLWRDRVSYLYHASPGMTAGQAVGRAGLFPADRSAIGVALWAQGDLRRVPARARPLVKRARDLGHALVDTDRPHRRSLGIALPGEEAAAVALSGRFSDKQLPALIERLRQTVHDIASPTDA